MTELGIGTIPEIFDGDPPHRARGAISQAWSVAALLRIIQRYEPMTKANNDPIINTKPSDKLCVY